MNKSEIIEYLKTFPYGSHDYWIITGSAMVLYDIKEQTSDIDMGCTSAMADRLEQAGYAYKITESGNRHFQYDAHTEIFENWLNDTVTEVEGIPVITLQGLLEMKQELGREKDEKDIRLILDMMGKNESIY